MKNIKKLKLCSGFQVQNKNKINFERKYWVAQKSCDFSDEGEEILYSQLSFMKLLNSRWRV